MKNIEASSQSDCRKCNIDLLRCVSMFMVVVLHCCVHGLGYSELQTDLYNVEPNTPYLVWLVGISSIAVNLFFIISGYFHSTFKWRKMGSLYIQTAFWSGACYVFYKLFVEHDNARKSHIAYVCFTLCAIILNYLFYFIPISFDRYNVILLIIITTIFVTKSMRLIKISFREDKIVIMYILILTIQIFLSSIRYNQPIYESVFAEKYQYLILLYFIFTFCLSCTKDSLKNLESIIIVIGAVCAILIDIQVLVLYGRTHFLHINYGLRSETVRVISSANFIEISTALTFTKLLLPKHEITFLKRMIYLLFFIAGVINVFFVSQTRMSMILLVSVCSILFIVHGNEGKNFGQLTKKIVSVFVVFLVIYNLINSEFALRMIDEFSNQVVSVDNRVNAINFFVQQITSSLINLIFGSGMVYDQNVSYG